MNCLILVLLLLCGQNNGCCMESDCDARDNGRRNGDGCRNNSCSTMNLGGGSNCGCERERERERQDNNDCGCRSELRPEPRFEQRPFMFGQGNNCGCEEQPKNNCDC
ncbi:MAG: hypothetical protein K2O16_10425 [Lachnospiraceae bacterium]|nr:hypothetical protein [Lachnospiraceae bacterium]